MIYYGIAFLKMNIVFFFFFFTDITCLLCGGVVADFKAFYCLPYPLVDEKLVMLSDETLWK